MPRGRPKGSKNKPKQETELVNPNVKIIGLTETRKDEMSSDVSINPAWILTKTANGTPIAIETIYKCGSQIEFLVIPHYKSKTYKVMIKSEDVIKPDNLNEERSKILENIKFYTPPCEKPKIVITPEIEKNE